MFRVGDPSTELYIIETGKVSISGYDENNVMKILCIREALDFFGEVALDSKDKEKGKEQRQRPTEAKVFSIL